MMNKHLVSKAVAVVALLAGMAALSVGAPATAASCTSTDAASQSHCLAGLTPIDRTAAFYPLATRYHWTLTDAGHRFSSITVY